jgi:ArsR family transcriptional regulator, arsenate/arsenite/antimonite-responsive transcriptional repressor
MDAVPPHPTPLSPQRIQLISRALADPRRFELLQQVAESNPSPCSNLRACCPITAPTLSHHLRELEAAELVTLEKRGKFVDVHFRRDTWELYLAALGKL